MTCANPPSRIAYDLPDSLASWRSWGGQFPSHFTDEETEAPEPQVACESMLSLWVVGIGLEALTLVLKPPVSHLQPSSGLGERPRYEMSKKLTLASNGKMLYDQPLVERDEN